MENLYTGTLRQEVYPSLTYLTHTPPYNLVQIRLKKERRAETLALLQQTWEKINPNVPFEYQDIYEEFMLSNRKTIELAHLLIMYSIISRGDLVSIKSSVYRLGRDRFRDCRSYHVVFAELLAGEFRISGGHIHRNMPAVRRYRIDSYATDRKQA